jgi:predicted aspartyl protease
MMVVRASASLLLLFLVSACVSSPVDCKIRVITSTPLEVRNRLLIVTAGIEGKPVTLLVDTGAERTLLSEQAARRLGLARDPTRITRSAGMGGTYQSHDAIVPALVLGGKNIPIDRIAVGQLRFGRGLTADGLLGADILLGNYIDDDIDVPDRTLTLYHARRCPNDDPPWHQPWARIDGVQTFKDRLLVPLTVDGVSGMGILDTGAQATTLGHRMAVRLGLTAADMADDPIVRHHGAGPGSQVSRLHQFHTLKIGPAVATDPSLSVLPVDIGGADALIGEDFIDGRRIWLSFSSHDVFIATRKSELALPPLPP